MVVQLLHDRYLLLDQLEGVSILLSPRGMAMEGRIEPGSWALWPRST